MKDKAFARAVDRQAMLGGAELLGIPFDEHVEFVIAAMVDHADELGLQGVAAE
jgi:predicted hydrolase (HD superfamily)